MLYGFVIIIVTIVEVAGVLGLGFVLEMLYGFLYNLNVICFDKDIGIGNIIHFYYYNSKRSSGSRSNMIGIGNIIEYWFSFWYMFENIEVLK